jgi:hypothetical protein
MGQHTARDLVEEEDVVVTLWRDGLVRRTTQAPPISSRVVPVAQVWGNTLNDVAFFTAGGRAAVVPLHQLPSEQDAQVSALAGLDRSDRVVSALVLPHQAEGEELPNTFLTLVTRGGRIKRLTPQEFSAASRDVVTAMKVEAEDQLGWVAETNGQNEILLATRQGKAIRFSEEDVRPMGLSAAGVLAVKLGSDDAVVGMGIVQADGFVVTFSEQGYAKRTAINNFPLQKRYGGGVQAARLTGQTGRLAVAALVGERDQVVLGTAKGGISGLPARAIRVHGRAATGGRSREDTKEPFVDVEKQGAPELLTVLTGKKATARQARVQKARRARGRKPATSETPVKRASRSRARSGKESGSKSAPAKAGPTSADGTATAPKEEASRVEVAKEEVAEDAAVEEAAAIRAGTDDEAEAEQKPLPMRSAPTKAGAVGAGTKPATKTGRKPRSVRSVPQKRS